jgi:hypothetical protein
VVRTPSAGFVKNAGPKRPIFSGGTENPVSFIPSGSNTRSRRNVSNGCRAARAMITPRTSAPVS